MSDYKVNDDGQIMNPGKFEAEQLYCPMYWDRVMNGCEDETIYDNDRPVAICIVTDEDRQQYAGLALSGAYAIALVESDQGFVTATEMSLSQLDAFRTLCES